MATSSTSFDDESAFVKSTTVTQDSESVTMRDAKDAARLRQMQIDEETACDSTKRSNIWTNVFGVSVRARTYRS